MDQIKATLRSKTDLALGSVPIPLPAMGGGMPAAEGPYYQGDGHLEAVHHRAGVGWLGEGFEQRVIRVAEGSLNVHPWNSGEWSIQTDEERFGQQQMGGMTLGQSL